MVASLLWGGLVFASSRGYIDLGLAPAQPAQPAETAAADGEPNDVRKSDHGKRHHSSATGSKRPHSDNRTGDSTSGDDLGGNDPRRIDMNSAGGEEQLNGTEIEKGFDGAFAQVRRCLILAASDEPVHGKVIFGLRITSAGAVSGVSLSGPSSVTQGEAGACLRKAAAAIHFRSFHGPDMVVHYPLTLE